MLLLTRRMLLLLLLLKVALGTAMRVDGGACKLERQHSAPEYSHAARYAL
jgi:hypothetical protein